MPHTMRIYLSTSKRFYPQVAAIKLKLENLGHTVTPPNGYNDINAEALIQRLDPKTYQSWKADMLRKNSELVSAHDAVLALNLSDGEHIHYIGGSTFLEIFKAFELSKRIYLYEQIAPGIFRDELVGMSPRIIEGKLTKIAQK
jgi:hypothetical protein